MTPPTTPAMLVLLGNDEPVDGGDAAVTRFDIPEGVSIAEAFRTVVDVFDPYHSTQPPAWVESDNEQLATLLAGQYGCPTSRPKKWKGLGDEQQVSP